MNWISPLRCSPEVECADTREAPVQQKISRRLTQDLETDGLLPLVSPSEISMHSKASWSFLDQYGDMNGILDEECPFDEEGNPLQLPPALSLNGSSTDSFDSSPLTTSENSGETNILMTPILKDNKVQKVLGETIELGNTTFDKLNSTVTKANTTITKTNLRRSFFACNVSSTPLHTASNVTKNLTSDLITTESTSPDLERKLNLEQGLSLDPIAPASRLSFNNTHQKPTDPLYVNSTLPIELDIKPTDSTVDYDNEVFEPQDNPDTTLVSMKPHAVPEKEKSPLTPRKMSLTPKKMPLTPKRIPLAAQRKSLGIPKAQKKSLPPSRQGQAHKSTLPLMTSRPSQRGSLGSKLLHGMRQASSASTLPRPRRSLAPTSMRSSRSYEKISTVVNAPATMSKLKK